MKLTHEQYEKIYPSLEREQKCLSTVPIQDGRWVLMKEEHFKKIKDKTNEILRVIAEIEEG